MAYHSGLHDRSGCPHHRDRRSGRTDPPIESNSTSRTRSGRDRRPTTVLTGPPPTPPQKPSGPTTTLTQESPPETDTNRTPQQVDRQPRAIALPAKREYLLGTPFDKARYLLVSAALNPHTPESATFVLQVHFMSEGQRGYHAEFCSCQFQLLTDTQSIPPHDYFIDQVPVGENRDRNLSFPLETPATHATLRIQVGFSSTEIPLEFLSASHTP